MPRQVSLPTEDSLAVSASRLPRRSVHLPPMRLQILAIEEILAAIQASLSPFGLGYAATGTPLIEGVVDRRRRDRRNIHKPLEMSEGDLGDVEGGLRLWTRNRLLPVEILFQLLLSLGQRPERIFGAFRHTGSGGGFDDAMNGSQVAQHDVRSRGGEIDADCANVEDL